MNINFTWQLKTFITVRLLRQISNSCQIFKIRKRDHFVIYCLKIWVVILTAVISYIFVTTVISHSLFFISIAIAELA
ncbi:MAG: hypothetical protein N2202_09880 [Proteobacteria bacterium]|nr:hypothetical protein [Pseudomonadota bacterium]